ncbi:hypothetical protein [Photobacterium galatheae]|uniref:Uncharacterized protein n=1 Tax=Photobacterium galatheae TaxID=1654360 RepID=A0A066RHI3_9GAMM|nr:hypothetical protein [Photobacterium galatheae]KDM89764.1 hypothetical protein EA58_20120 [Photobacterium galatheae]MCM0151416.1 hypothetical protein [Photobacterium galatheae]
MKDLDSIKKKYKHVQHQLNTAPNLEDWAKRYAQCRKIYKNQVKKEPAILEWEVDYWGRFGKWGLPVFVLFAFTFVPLFPLYWLAGDQEDIYQILFMCFCVLPLPILIMVLGAEWFPTRYYQKITASGFYSYGVKLGRERRQKMAKYCMMGGFAIAIILLFFAGPMVFAGVGAASLSFLKLGSIPESEPEESAWPWLGIYSLVLLKKPFLYHLYKVGTHGDNYLILTKEQLVQVQEILKQYGQHEVDILDKEEGVFFSRWWQHQETMPFRRVKAPNREMPATDK